MKKAAVILIVILAFGLSACEKNNTSPDTTLQIKNELGFDIYNVTARLSDNITYSDNTLDTSYYGATYKLFEYQSLSDTILHGKISDKIIIDCKFIRLNISYYFENEFYLLDTIFNIYQSTNNIFVLDDSMKRISTI